MMDSNNVLRPEPASTMEKGIEPATLTVLTRIRESIVTGAFPAGTKLVAMTLAKELGVSRTPVRSALAVLSAEGLTSYSVNKGYAVRAIGVLDVLDAIEARAVLEARACGLSVDFGWSEEEFTALKAFVEAGRTIVDGEDWSCELETEWYKANRDFHSLIVRKSRNAAIRNAIRMTIIYPVFGDAARLAPVVARYVPQRHRSIPSTVPAHIVQSQADHERILDMILSGDAKESERLMEDHVLRSRDRIAALTSRR